MAWKNPAIKKAVDRHHDIMAGRKMDEWVSNGLNLVLWAAHKVHGHGKRRTKATIVRTQRLLSEEFVAGADKWTDDYTNNIDYASHKLHKAVDGILGKKPRVAYPMKGWSLDTCIELGIDLGLWALHMEHGLGAERLEKVRSYVVGYQRLHLTRGKVDSGFEQIKTNVAGILGELQEVGA